MFRPSFERLENREVFSANPLANMPLATPADGPDQQPVDVYVEEISLRIDSYNPTVNNGLPQRAVTTDAGANARNDAPIHGGDRGQLLAGTFGRGIGDFNGDGKDDLSTIVTDNCHPDLSRKMLDDLIGWNSLRPTASIQLDFDDTGNVHRQNQILPYMEQDNLYKSSDSVRDSIFSDETFVSSLFPSGTVRF